MCVIHHTVFPDLHQWGFGPLSSNNPEVIQLIKHPFVLSLALNNWFLSIFEWRISKKPVNYLSDSIIVSALLCQLLHVYSAWGLQIDFVSPAVLLLFFCLPLSRELFQAP